MFHDDNIPRLCRETQALRVRATLVVANAQLSLDQLRQLLDQRSSLKQWTAEVRSSTPQLLPRSQNLSSR